DYGIDEGSILVDCLTFTLATGQEESRRDGIEMETLAVVAYRQPVSRSRVSAVRGVNCDGVMRTLVQRGLVEEAGSEPETGAILYRTTNYFLERMGLRGLDELPELAPFLPEVDDVEAESLEGTMIAEAVAAAAAQAADGSGEAGRAGPDR
ncbi:SMC-Scp complex subunit ScpB, partial [Kitasatospora sp. NPDC036755]|uniref:SMC-Scp complex subunit ScpB n=1 Tax=Kitasatospora sp. NPDC036755 TaxID=3154600 RepID=UPI00340EE1F3